MNDYFAFAVYVIIVVAVAGSLFELYHLWRTHQKQPPVTPVTVSHIAAVQNEVKLGVAKLGESLKQHMEALHAKLDKK